MTQPTKYFCAVFARALGLAALAVVSGCVADGTALDQPPVLAAVTPVNNDLRDVPPPEHIVTVAVYNFDDLTGQYKDTDNVQTLSRAVTQGGAALLIKALQDAGNRRWFSVLERNQLNDLLKERQIITEMRRLYRNETKINPHVLPPLMHAGIIVEGGITGYDTNVVTGGIGARYLGIGANTKYIKDTVTVTLRAVSTKTGEVLASVNTRKEIASYKLQGDAFRYLELDKIFEAEAGVTYNEPKQVAVEAAIDKAVLALIVQGSQLDIWKFADPQAGHKYIDAYLHEKFKNNLTLSAETAPPPETRHPAMNPFTRPLVHTASARHAVAPRVTPEPQRSKSSSPDGTIPDEFRKQQMLPPPPQANEQPAG